VLGPKTRQLHRDFTYPATGVTDGQLRTWSYLGMFSGPVGDEEIAGLDRLSAIGDAPAPLEARVRSYLDANCANCHRPGADIPAAFDARFDTPLGEAGIIDHSTVSDSLGIDRPRVVAPGDPERSLLWRRMVLPERFKMPPLARNQVDEEAAEAVREWIEGLRRAGD
jgi:mono/diheme cytochrome c family protein